LLFVEKAIHCPAGGRFTGGIQMSRFFQSLFSPSASLFLSKKSPL